MKITKVNDDGGTSLEASLRDEFVLALVGNPEFLRIHSEEAEDYKPEFPEACYAAAQLLVNEKRRVDDE